MARAYSLDLRERVAGSVEDGMTCAEAAELYSVSESSAIKWSRRKRETGSAAALPQGGRKPRKLDAHRDWLLARLDEKPDLTLAALRDELRQARGAVVCIDTLWRFLKACGRSFKKNLARRRAGQA